MTLAHPAPRPPARHAAPVPARRLPVVEPSRSRHRDPRGVWWRRRGVTLAFLAATLPADIALVITQPTAADLAAAVEGARIMVLPDILTDTASWALILGFLTPLLTAVVQQPTWSTRARTVVGAVVSVVIGVVTVLASGDLGSATSVLGVIALVLVASGTAYQTLWKPSGVAEVIELSTARKRRDGGTGSAAA